MYHGLVKKEKIIQCKNQKKTKKQYLEPPKDLLGSGDFAFSFKRPGTANRV